MCHGIRLFWPFFYLLPVFFFLNSLGFQDLLVEGDRILGWLMVRYQSGMTAFSVELRLGCLFLITVLSLSDNSTSKIKVQIITELCELARSWACSFLYSCGKSYAFYHFPSPQEVGSSSKMILQWCEVSVLVELSAEQTLVKRY